MTYYYQGVLEKIKAIICSSFGIDANKINDHTKIINGGIDLSSLDLVQLIVAIESKFDIQIVFDICAENIFYDLSTLSRHIVSVINNEEPDIYE